jgi:serine/threonine protein kinase
LEIFLKKAPFALPSSVSPIKDSKLSATVFPVAGDQIKLSSGEQKQLGDKVSAGGEGVIYQIKEMQNHVCKIYHPEKLTLARKNKIELMLSREIKFEGLCWPEDIVLNKDGQFVGYIMPKASGKPIQLSMFVKPVLLKNFPTWKRSNLIDICLLFLDKVEYLHAKNVIIGDINPLNVLVEKNGKIWFVDTDSYQIENFSCPVGTVNFTAPEIQGKDYGGFLRTKDNELFAIATMIFMILFPGKPPYAQQGGESPASNIKKMNFPYMCSKNNDQNPPEGPWNFIWGNLPEKIKDGFCQTFSKNKRLGIGEWKKILQNYKAVIGHGHFTNEIFPLTFRIRNGDGIEIKCDKCGNKHTESKRFVEKLTSQGKEVWCGKCRRENKLGMLANQSRNSRAQTVGSSYSAPKTIWGTQTTFGGNKSQTNQKQNSGGYGGISYKNKQTGKGSTTNYSNKSNDSFLGGVLKFFFYSIILYIIFKVIF